MYEGSLCLCCMSTENLVHLFVPEPEKTGAENYANMLALCLRIPVTETDGHDFICTFCVDKLKDSICFKKQALKSIAILTSVNLTELLPVEELELLGLTEPEHVTELEQQSATDVLSDCETSTEDISIASTQETKKKVKRKVIEIRIPQSQKETNSHKVQESPSERVSPTRWLVGAGAGAGAKRAVGRPRTRSPALPYRVGADELSCRECGLQCPTHITLKVHYNSHFGRHVCSLARCGKRFMTRASLRKHAAAHRPGPFRCDNCDQEFSKLNTLLSHKRLKHGATLPYRCGECGVRFRTAARRRTHLAAAHARTDRRYACRYCDKKFLHSGSLHSLVFITKAIRSIPLVDNERARAKHVSCVHESARVQCARCGACVRRAALATHLRRHDAPLPGDRHKQRRFLCLLCGATFAQKHTLQYHVGSHTRRGHYAGDGAALMADTTRSPHASQGLLSDLQDTDEQHLDESALSDDPPPLDASNTSPASHMTEDKQEIPPPSDNELQVSDSCDNERATPVAGDYDLLSGDVETLEDDLYNYLDFNALPSDFDD
ncbi:hypothetical protein O0L34_g4092 [Tuta absoluta]|nr:hypothetical protein O0L34_g4092 [Tuta absoluta]